MRSKAVRRIVLWLLTLQLTLGSALAAIQTLPLDQSGGYPVSTANLIGKEEYQDESIHVTTSRINFKGASCLVVYVTIANATQLRTAMTRDDYEKKEYITTKLLAKKKSAVLSINGDFFKYNDFGYLVRQGQLYRDRADGEHDVLLIDENADFYSVPAATDATIHDAVAGLEAEGHKVVNSFNFGPTLVENGQVLDFNQSLYQGLYKMMRVAIAQLGPLSYAVYFCYGTSDARKGLTLANFADLIVQTNPEVKVAYNLDGGGSTHVLLLQKQLHTNPSGRDICDLLYFASASDLLGDRSE